MEYIIDDPGNDQQFQKILREITLYKNGEVAASMKAKGIVYKQSWGVSVPDLKRIASAWAPSHLMALKLWNRQWRETMILAALLDEPGKVAEQQMDFWTKSFENSEIAELVSANLWWKCPPAYVKALEWYRGKKHWVRYTAVHLTGRLALSDKKSPDEMFDPFFEEMVTLSRDPALALVMERTLVLLAHRSAGLAGRTAEFLQMLDDSGNTASMQLAENVRAGMI